MPVVTDLSKKSVVKFPKGGGTERYKPDDAPPKARPAKPPSPPPETVPEQAPLPVTE